MEELIKFKMFPKLQINSQSIEKKNALDVIIMVMYCVYYYTLNCFYFIIFVHKISI